MSTQYIYILHRFRAKYAKQFAAIFSLVRLLLEIRPTALFSPRSNFHHLLKCEIWNTDGFLLYITRIMYADQVLGLDERPWRVSDQYYLSIPDTIRYFYYYFFCFHYRSTTLPSSYTIAVLSFVFLLFFPFTFIITSSTLTPLTTPVTKHNHIITADQRLWQLSRTIMLICLYNIRRYVILLNITEHESLSSAVRFFLVISHYTPSTA